MDSIGAEVGQKMRSAIKAKLLELNCYVDEELPDYIMVMVANKRTKSQMNEDLRLFLSTQTSTFVEWLHIVLRKLREVTVTNPEVYRRVIKPKSPVYPDQDVKKERYHSNIALKAEKVDNMRGKESKFADDRKVSIVKRDDDNFDDNFDIPLLSEVSMSTQEDLDELERKIKSVKSRLGILVESDAENDGAKKQVDGVNIRTRLGSPIDKNVDHHLDNGTKHRNETEYGSSLAEDSSGSSKRQKHTPITFDLAPEEPPRRSRKRPVLERLGRRILDEDDSRSKRSRRDDKLSRRFRDRSRSKERRSNSRNMEKAVASSMLLDSKRDKNKGILSRLGVMSKVSVPHRERELEPEDELKKRDVRSMVQVKPRVIPADIPQPSKNLLLKAVAEAQKSIEQSVKRKSNLSSNDVKKHNHKTKQDRPIVKNQLNPSSTDQADKKEFIPKLLTLYVSDESMDYVPSSRELLEDPIVTDYENSQNFVVTLDGADKCLVSSDSKTSITDTTQRQRPSAMSRLDKRKSPSPITFNNTSKPQKIVQTSKKHKIPDKLPIVHPPLSVKNKERCKYWPGCRQGDKCEFVHPNSNCEAFPNCKFGEKCIFLHPPCKFGTSCTKRECPFSHTTSLKPEAGRNHQPKLNVAAQICKYFPKCVNPNCVYYHPKPCMYGKYCKNQAACGFSHFSNNKPNMSWKSK